MQDLVKLRIRKLQSVVDEIAEAWMNCFYEWEEKVNQLVQGIANLKGCVSGINRLVQSESHNCWEMTSVITAKAFRITQNFHAKKLHLMNAKLDSLGKEREGLRLRISQHKGRIEEKENKLRSSLKSIHSRLQYEKREFLSLKGEFDIYSQFTNQSINEAVQLTSELLSHSKKVELLALSKVKTSISNYSTAINNLERKRERIQKMAQVNVIEIENLQKRRCTLEKKLERETNLNKELKNTYQCLRDQFVKKI